MRVLHVSRSRESAASTGLGGLERFLEGLVAAQKAEGLDVNVLEVPSDALEEAGDLAVHGSWERVSEIGQALLAGFEFEILHCHDWYAAPLAEASMRTGRRSIIATAHLPLRRGFTYRDTGCTWQAKEMLEGRLFELARTVVAPSLYLSQFIAQEYGLVANRLDLYQESALWIIGGTYTDHLFQYSKIRSKIATTIENGQKVSSDIRLFYVALFSLIAATLALYFH